jgi:hypothetical protein
MRKAQLYWRDNTRKVQCPHCKGDRGWEELITPEFIEPPEYEWNICRTCLGDGEISNLKMAIYSQRWTRANKIQRLCIMPQLNLTPLPLADEVDLFWNLPNSHRAFVIISRVLIIAILTLSALGIYMGIIKIVTMYMAIIGGQ